MGYILTFALGACVGNIFLYYLNKKQKQVSRKTAYNECSVCGHNLSARELIPIFSYIFMRGRCRYCGKRYPVATLLSEVVCGCGFLFAAYCAVTVFQTGDYETGAVRGILFILLSFAAVNDIYCHECAYVLQFSILGIGILYTIVFGHVVQLTVGMFCAIFLLLLNTLFLKLAHIPDAIGFADISVCMGAACVISPYAVPLMLLFACVISAFVLPVVRMNQRQQGIEEGQFSVGLIPFLMFGAFFAQVLGEYLLTPLFS